MKGGTVKVNLQSPTITHVDNSTRYLTATSNILKLFYFNVLMPIKLNQWNRKCLHMKGIRTNDNKTHTHTTKNKTNKQTEPQQTNKQTKTTKQNTHKSNQQSAQTRCWSCTDFLHTLLGYCCWQILNIAAVYYASQWYCNSSFTQENHTQHVKLEWRWRRWSIEDQGRQYCRKDGCGSLLTNH